MKDKQIKFAATYKCRMCGGTFQKGRPVTAYTAYRKACSLAMMEATIEDDRTYIRAAHICIDVEGAVGIGDFIGYTVASEKAEE